MAEESFTGNLRIFRKNIANHFDIEKFYPTDWYFLKRFSSLSSKQLLREEISSQKKFVRLEAYLGIEDLRYLSVVLVIEEDGFVKEKILERMKELRKEETYDHRKRSVAGNAKQGFK